MFQGQPRWSSAPRRHSSKAKSIRWRPQAVLRHAVKLRWPALLLVAFWVRWTLCAPQKWLGAMEPRPACLPPCCRVQSVRGLHPHHHVCSPNILGIRFRREEREGPLHIAGGYRKRFSLLRGGNTERARLCYRTPLLCFVVLIGYVYLTLRYAAVRETLEGVSESVQERLLLRLYTLRL